MSVTSARSTFFVGHRLKQRLRPLLAGGERVDHVRPQRLRVVLPRREEVGRRSSGCRTRPARGRPRSAPRRPRPCGPCSSSSAIVSGALSEPSCRTASARASAARPVFAAIATARLSAAGSRKMTASLFASATSFGSFSLASSACSAAQPAGASTGLPVERDREPVERLLAARGVLQLRDELDAQLEVVGLPGGDEPAHDLRHDLVADELVVGRLLREPREFGFDRRAAGVSRLRSLAFPG